MESDKKLNLESEQEITDEKTKEHSLSAEKYKILQKKFVDEKSKLNILEKVEKANNLVLESKIDEAYKIMQKLCSDFEKGLTFENTEEYSVFSFLNHIEFLAYIFDKKRNSDIHFIDSEYFHMYKMLGYILVELNDFDGAEQAFQKAKRWNPVSADVDLELADMELKKGNMKKAIDLTKRAFKYATSAEILAHCYRKLGYCYIELQNYNLASALYLYSLIFEDNRIAHEELMYIEVLTKSELKFPSGRKEIECILNEYDIPLQASDLIIAAYIKFLQFFEDNNDKENFLFYFEKMEKMITKEEILERFINLAMLKNS